MEECFGIVVWLKDSYRIKRQNLSHNSQASIVVWLRVLANKKNLNSEDDGSKDRDNSVDLWQYELR